MIQPRKPFPTENLSEEIDALLDANQSVFTTQRWNAHGARFAFHTDDASLRQIIGDLMRCFPPDESEAPPNARLVVATRQQWDAPAQAEVFPRGERAVDLAEHYGLEDTFARIGDLNIYELAPLGGALYSIGSGQGLGYVMDPNAFDAWIIMHLFLQTVVLDLLRGQGLYWLHAGAVALEGRAALLAGLTGSGKTTTTLALVEGGFKFLSEDRMFARLAGEGEIELLPFAPDVAITLNTARMLPSLAARLPRMPDPLRKLEAPPETLFPGAMAERAMPGLVLFPQVTENPRSEAQPISAAESLQRLLPHSLLASQAAVNSAHFDALAKLVAASRSYALALGPDVDALPALVRALFEE